jgi:hypothetical protein
VLVLQGFKKCKKKVQWNCSAILLIAEQISQNSFVQAVNKK